MHLLFVRQYAPPLICIAVPSWLLSIEERETQQHTPHLYCSTPPICTATLLRTYWGLGSLESFREKEGFVKGGGVATPYLCHAFSLIKCHFKSAPRSEPKKGSFCSTLKMAFDKGNARHGYAVASPPYDTPYFGFQESGS